MSVWTLHCGSLQKLLMNAGLLEHKGLIQAALLNNLVHSSRVISRFPLTHRPDESVCG